MSAENTLVLFGSSYFRKQSRKNSPSAQGMDLDYKGRGLDTVVDVQPF